MTSKANLLCPLELVKQTLPSQVRDLQFLHLSLLMQNYQEKGMQKRKFLHQMIKMFGQFTKHFSHFYGIQSL